MARRTDIPMPKAKDLDVKEFAREETIDALLRRIVAYTVILKVISKRRTSRP